MGQHRANTGPWSSRVAKMKKPIVQKRPEDGPMLKHRAPRKIVWYKTRPNDLIAQKTPEAEGPLVQLYFMVQNV